MTPLDIIIVALISFDIIIGLCYLVVLRWPFSFKKLDIYKNFSNRFLYYKGLKVMTKKDIQQLKNKVINHDI